MANDFRDVVTGRKLVTVRTVSLYPLDWVAIEAFATERGYPSVSSALRRIIDEWRTHQVELHKLATDCLCDEERTALMAG